MSFSASDQATEHHEMANLSKQSHQLLTQKIQGFDYAVLNPQVRIMVEGKTSELKGLMRRSAQDIINIGQKLVEVKEQLGHGNFRAWLKTEFDWSLRTAARFMQVSTQFKCANLAHLNIAVSALYFLAKPSIPEEARKQVLEIAKEGEYITYAKAKAIISFNQEEAQPNFLNSATVDISATATESNSFTPLQPNQSLQTHSQLEPKDETNLAAVELPIKTVPTIELEQKAVEKTNSVLKEDSKVSAQLQPEHSNHIRVLNIKHQNPELITNIAQTFEVTFAGVRINVEGDPEALILLFKQMQNNPVFTEEVLQHAKLLATH